ncbi:MAG: DUF2628 domain-containing protein [Alphaproteobacteria bacterium]
MFIKHRKSITLSFSERQFIEFLHGTEHAKYLMKEQDEQQFDYYRKVYRNWKNGENTWNWGAAFFGNLWMIYRGLFLVVISLTIIETLLPQINIFLFFILGFYRNTFLKYWLEYQLKKRTFKNICKTQFDTPVNPPVVILSILYVLTIIISEIPLSAPLLETFNQAAEITILITLLFLHLYYYHIKPRFKRKKST